MLRLPAAFLVVNGLLMLPHWILEGGLGPRWLALEAVLLVGLAAALPRRRWSRALAWVAAVAVAAVVLVDLGDVAARRSLGRPLNLYLDAHLLASVRHLLDGALGAVGGAAAALLALVAVGGAVWSVARLLRPAADPAGGPSFPARRRVGAALAVLAAGGLALGSVDRDALGPRLATPVVRVVRDQSRSVIRTVRERERFARALADVPATYADRPRLLAGLGGADVTLAFVESYGISALEDPRYGPVVRPRLEAAREELRSAGVVVATGVLEAPSQGGQSWFGHGSVLSGVWLDDQMRYDLLLASERETLVDDFRRAGYRTAAIMPAITMAWPEGRLLGYDEIFDHEAIDYAGPPLNWVTMPDQFTWSFLERSVRAREPGRPLFAELGLISSHAPWTPILTVMDDWDAVGDGSVFQRWADAGETPAELWKDGDRVREHYARSVEYAVHAAFSYAARYVGPGELLIVLGDHQPAPLITGEDAPRTVPVHVLSADSALVRPFVEWGFRPGTLPPPAEERGPARRMDAFRAWFVEAFTPPDRPEAS